jgi:mannose-6-phosphate isomerase-like protein (cupin superfamily)
MKVIKSREFTADRAWGALDITTMNGVSCRLHWTDAPYKWHVNDGEEVFAVMQGQVRGRALRKNCCSMPAISFTPSPAMNM